MKIREAEVEDVKDLINLWKETGLYFKPFDEEKKLVEKIKKEAELLLVAEDKGHIIGAVIGNYGWRVSIDHLAVHQNYRLKGIGRRLFEEIKKRLNAKGATVALVDSTLPKEFWKKLKCEYRGNYNNYTTKL